jgi:hypothetical protein
MYSINCVATSCSFFMRNYILICFTLVMTKMCKFKTPLLKCYFDVNSRNLLACVAGVYLLAGGEGGTCYAG